jgi:DNA ligase D-like protein (predicted 3'-phosphoesterase)
MPLTKYREKRNFEISAQPLGNSQKTTGEQQPRLYVIQKHRATQIHYDFRLESNGEVLSWAIPKRSSLDPSAKSLAMQVEHHPPLAIARESGSDVEKAATRDPGNKSKANARAIRPRERKKKRGTR